MKIQKIEIKKFRSIDKCSFQFDKINAIVGQNNSGKSAVIRALNCFFNPKREEIAFIRGQHSYTNKSKPKIAITFTDFGDLFAELNQANTFTVEQVYESSKRRLVYSYFTEDKKKKALPDKYLDVIQKQIAFVYIPPNRNPEELKWEENTLIKELVEEFLEKETNKRDTLTPKFQSSINHLEKGPLRKISQSVEGKYALSHSFKFLIGFKKGVNYLNFLNEIEIKIDENGSIHNLSDCGTGLQSITIIALHRVLANLRHQNIILGLEEPETNLHPQAQRELIRSISDSSKNQEVAHVVLTSHSTVIIDNIDHRSIALIRKVKDKTRVFKSNLIKVPSNFFQKYSLAEFSYYQFHGYKNSDFFFANHIIFVESKNDAEVVKFLAQMKNIPLDLLGISIISLDGVHNLPYPFYLVKELGIPYTVILDKDYFIPYLNDDLNSSRNAKGFPKYRYEYKSNTLINDLIPSSQSQAKLLHLMKTNHSKALDTFADNNIICMKYNLEMDLMCSQKTIEIMSEILSVAEKDRNSYYLLTKKNKAVKKISNIHQVLSQLSSMNLPNSYKRIQRVLEELKNKYK